MTEKENTVIFKTGSKILKYISQKTQLSKTIMNDFTLNQILTILKDIIMREEMFDPLNPSMIMCSEELEEAINMKAIHVTEMQELVAKQLKNGESFGSVETFLSKSIIRPFSSRKDFEMN